MKLEKNPANLMQKRDSRFSGGANAQLRQKMPHFTYLQKKPLYIYEYSGLKN